jgi:deoxyribodipyrimidine photo-lyase
MNIFIFHRDLRLTDNTTLIKQMKSTKNIIPIFIFTPEQINKKTNKYFSNNSVQFMIESLHELYNNINDHNGKLYFFYNNTMKVLKELHKFHKIESIGFNLDYTPYALERDRLISQWANDNNITLYQEEDYPLYNIMDKTTINKNTDNCYLVYTPFKNNCLKMDVKNIDKFSDFKFTKLNLPSQFNLNDINDFYTDNPNINIHGGRSNGLKILAQAAGSSSSANDFEDG